MPSSDAASPLFRKEVGRIEAQEQVGNADKGWLDEFALSQFDNTKVGKMFQESLSNTLDGVEGMIEDHNDIHHQPLDKRTFDQTNYGSLPLGREKNLIVGESNITTQHIEKGNLWMRDTFDSLNDPNLQEWSNVLDEESAFSKEEYRHLKTSFCDDEFQGEKKSNMARSTALWGTLRDFVKDFDLHEYSDSLAKRESNNAISDEGIEDNTFLVDWKEMLAFLSVFFTVSVFGYSYVFENWRIVDSIYFSVVTFTTVGYGDMHPTNTASRIFTCCLALCGITYIGFILGVLGNKVVAAELKAMSKARNASARYFLRLFDANNSQPTTASSHTSVDSFPSDISCSTVQDYESIDEAFGKSIISGGSSWFSSVHGPARVFLLQWVPFACIVAVGASIMVSAYGWSCTEAVYFWIVTATTIGFGDFHPKHHPKGLRLLSVLLIPLAVGLMGVIIGSVAKTVMKRRRKTHMQGLLQTKLHLEDLDRMDADGDGRVTRLEYVEYMLVVMKLVDPETLRRLHGQFAKLDIDGCGTLSRNDLEIMAKRRKKALKAKLQLASYKYKLLHKGKRNNSLCTCCRRH